MTRFRHALIAVGVLFACSAFAAQTAPRTFKTPEDAVRALADAAKSNSLDALIAIFGDNGRELAESSDAATARQNRDVFIVAFREGWHLINPSATKRTLIVGNEDWPFPVPIVKVGAAWQFDVAAGKEEVIARRIGRNELAAISTCHTYVAAQTRYARDAHDGTPTGTYATTFASAPGKQNGLYWPAKHGEKLSPLGDLVADASAEGRPRGGNTSASPFNGYYFRILTAQGAHARGGTKDYIVNGRLTGGYALIAWPAQYDASGVMTFIVNQDGVVRQKDLGPETAARAAAITKYDPDATWHTVR